MDKNFLQDVVPPSGKRSIRNIPIPDHRKTKRPTINDELPTKRVIRKDAEEFSDIKVEKREKIVKPEITFPEQEEDEEDVYSREEEDEEELLEDRKNHFDRIHHNKASHKKPWVKYLSGVVIIVLIFLVLSATSKAEISIYPKFATANADVEIPLSESEEEGKLQYKKEELSETMSKNVSATGEESVTEKSTGTIIIYNSYSETEQKLIKNTRFETADGLIFRIEDSISVPGKSGNTPGSIEASVIADESGEQYNIGLADFTIPGFKDLPQFSSFYAKSKTPMTGGFEGTRKVVDEDDVEKVKAELETSLTEALINKTKESFSDDHFLLYNSNGFTMNTRQGESSGDQVAITVDATLVAYMVNKYALSSEIAKSILVDYDASDKVIIQNMEALQIEISEDGETIKVSGNPEFKWSTDIDMLKEKVVGTDRSEIKALLTSFSSISKADAVIKPFWKKNFPKNPDKITVIEVSEKE